MIEQAGKKKMLLFSGSSNVELASKVASNLGTELSTVESKEFASGEIYIRLNESVRGADCFVLQSHSGDVNKTIMEQLVLVDALKRASAKRITAVLPFYPYSRQDKKALPREPITARLIGDMFIAAGVDRLVSIDLHTQQIQGFVDQPFDHLTAMPLFVDYFKEKYDGPISIISPAVAPDASTTLVPFVAVKSVLTKSLTPFKYTSTSVKDSTAPLASAPVNAVWFAVATNLNNAIA